MCAIVDFVTQKLLEEVKEEYTKFGQITDNLLSALNCLFGQPLIHALDLTDRNAVEHIHTSTGKEVYQVRSNSGRKYTCPPSLEFCPCLSFAFGVMKRNELLTCKHILAIRLSKACFKCVEVEKSDKDFATIIYQQEY